MESGLIERLMVLDNITAPEELTAHIEQIVQVMGFDYFRLGIFIPVSHERPEIRILISCPEEWVESYSRGGMIARDPVVSKSPQMRANIRAVCLSSKRA